MPKEERQIKEITDNDLDTGRDLVTENYELEILTLKDKVDLRRFSRSFLKVDKLLKSIFTGKEDKFPKNSGFNREKTDFTENDTNKIFSAKGAFDLKNWLVTNYTTLMNNIKDNLNNSINTKLNHGGYDGTGQQLKNEIDTKVLKRDYSSDVRDLNLIIVDGFYAGYRWLNAPENSIAVLDVKKYSPDWIVQEFYSMAPELTKYKRSYISGTTWTPWVKIYDENNKPTPADIGLGNVNNTADNQKKVLEASILYVNPDMRDPKPNTTGIATKAGVKSFFTRGASIGVSSDYCDLLVMDTYTDNSGGVVNAIAFAKQHNGLYHLQAGWNSDNWASPARIYTTAFKPRVEDICPYRVGDIMETTNAEHPATTWTGTGWERYGNGRVIVGLNEGESEFNSIGKIGGAKEVALRADQNGPHNHTLTSVVGGGGWYGQGGGLGGFGGITTSTSGSGTPHSNLQPYIVAYRWRRTS